eukprot:scaffold288709_cov35-Attheya_sp.AAC.1
MVQVPMDKRRGNKLPKELLLYAYLEISCRRNTLSCQEHRATSQHGTSAEPSRPRETPDSKTQ